MKIRVAAFVVGLVAGALAPAPMAYARDPGPAKATATAKKPPAKQAKAAAPRNKDDTEPPPEAPSFSATAVGWQLVEDSKTGARLGVPEKLTPHIGAGRSGTRWSSAQGQIQIETFRLTEASLPALFDVDKKTARRQITSSSLKPEAFVILGVQGLKNFLERADTRDGEIRGVTVLYDQATEGTMGPVAVAVGNAFVGFPDPHAAPPPGLRRRVEYSSAIVVGSDGDLVTVARSVDDCQIITVPPFGHAARLAEDKTGGLALIRLYGARNLVAAPLADASAPDTDVTLVGVADPLAQSGGATASAISARLTGQALEPAPKLGFSGAAAVDARGRLAGLVDLRPSIVAGSGGAAAAGAALVPVETIRAFLQAQHIAPAPAAGAAINQSVLRVICVRK
jgi:hypothetical protein